MVDLERLKINSIYFIKRVALASRSKPENPKNGNSSSPEVVRHMSARYSAAEQREELETHALETARQKGLEAVSYEVFRKTLEEEESKIPSTSEFYEAFNRMQEFSYNGKHIVSLRDLEQVREVN